MTIERQSYSIPVQTTSGPILGFLDSRSLPGLNSLEVDHLPVQKFLGIPYARAERWKRPEPVRSWTYPLECYEFGPGFPQGPDPFFIVYDNKGGYVPRPPVLQSEEHGFNLNVFAPGATQSDDLLPVMVWIHGGALAVGGSSVMVYDPTELIRREALQDRRFIVVTGNYRVNLFGFMASQDLIEEDADGLAGNYGLYDCIAMLEWVQSNIKNFGGNPDNVTIFGESAGAFIVGSLLVTQKKLFRRAIMQSGCLESLTCRQPEDEATCSMYHELVEKYSNFGVSSAERLKALRNIPFEELLDFLDARGMRIDEYGMTLENPDAATAIWSRPAIELIRKGIWNPFLESIMLGTTRDEATMLAWLFGTTDDCIFDEFLKIRSPMTPRTALEQLYQGAEGSEHSSRGSFSRDPTYSHPSVGFLAHNFFDGPVEHFATIMSKTKHHKTGKKCCLFLYRFDSFIKEMDEQSGWGAFHTIDVPFIFNIKTLWSSDSNSSEALSSAKVGKCWVEFATTGVPDPEWPQFCHNSSPFRYIIGEPTLIENMNKRSEEERRQINFWIDKLDNKSLLLSLDRLSIDDSS